MCTSGPSIPAVTPPPAPPTPADPSVQAAAEAERRRQQAQRYQTLLTSGQGAGVTTPAQGSVPGAQPAPKTLIGG